MVKKENNAKNKRRSIAKKIRENLEHIQTTSENLADKFKSSFNNPKGKKSVNSTTQEITENVPSTFALTDHSEKNELNQQKKDENMVQGDCTSASHNPEHISDTSDGGNNKIKSEQSPDGKEVGVTKIDEQQVDQSVDNKEQGDFTATSDNPTTTPTGEEASPHPIDSVQFVDEDSEIKYEQSCDVVEENENKEQQVDQSQESKELSNNHSETVSPSKPRGHSVLEGNVKSDADDDDDYFDAKNDDNDDDDDDDNDDDDYVNANDKLNENKNISMKDNNNSDLDYVSPTDSMVDLDPATPQHSSDSEIESANDDGDANVLTMAMKHPQLKIDRIKTHSSDSEKEVGVKFTSPTSHSLKTESQRSDSFGSFQSLIRKRKNQIEDLKKEIKNEIKNELNAVTDKINQNNHHIIRNIKELKHDDLFFGFNPTEDFENTVDKDCVFAFSQTKAREGSYKSKYTKPASFEDFTKKSKNYKNLKDTKCIDEYLKCLETAKKCGCEAQQKAEAGDKGIIKDEEKRRQLIKILLEKHETIQDPKYIQKHIKEGGYKKVEIPKQYKYLLDKEDPNNFVQYMKDYHNQEKQ